MSTPEDMAACQRRDCFGNPSMAAGRDNNNNQVSGASVLMVDSSRLMPLMMLSCFLAGGGMFTAIMVAWLLPGRITAEIRGETAQQVADARAEARMAGTDAAIAKNNVQKLEARLNERR